MYHKILQLLNIKPSETAVVRELFTIQFFLGVATAFLFTSSLTMFISSYEITMLPVSYILSAGLLLIFNRVYAYLEHRLRSTKLLEAVIIFSAVSILSFWLLLNTFPFKNLPLIIAGWYMLIYMLVGYAFWGMASIIFNVRESKRLFSIVGAGDIPAKMLGYFSVTAVVPLIGINNMLWVSIVSFFIAVILLRKFEAKGLLDHQQSGDHSESHDNKPPHSIHTSGFITKFFDNRLVFSIALLSLVSYTVFSFIDFTFLSDVKIKYHHSEQIATFIAVFFAAGRFLAIGIKILFSSRMISRIGLTNALLVTPVLLLLIDAFIIISGDRFVPHLFIFGFMVLLTEILRSTLQEPVFFILFQPLKPHDRLRGHLVAKGHTLPFALLAVGTFLLLYFRSYNELPIIAVGELLVALLVIWIATVYIIKKQYLQTLITSLKRGYFTGSELFLNDSAVTNLLIAKTESKKPLEVIHSLNLLERSGYIDLYKVLLKKVHSTEPAIKDYILTRIIANNMTSALPIIKQQLEQNTDPSLLPRLLKAFYFLNKDFDANDQAALVSLPPEHKKAAMEGLLSRKQPETEKLVIDILQSMSTGSLADKLLALDVIFECECENYTAVLEPLLNDSNSKVYKKAIEACGKVRNYKLLTQVVEVAALRKAYPSFKRAIISYGDETFTEDNWQHRDLKGEMLNVVIKATANIKGDFSTNFLLEVLKKDPAVSSEIIEALWLKRSVVTTESISLIDEWANEKTRQLKYKVDYFYEVQTARSFTLLSNAIMMEIRKDAQLLLKAFSLMYDREKVDRVIELFNNGNNEKISNAIEILELTIPKKYFMLLNEAVELIADVQQNKQLLTKAHGLPANTLIEEVINDNKAGFSEWTRSVACYMIPTLSANEIPMKLLKVKDPKESFLFNETKNHVLSMLN